ncbi:MAG: response regulator transcription factor [Eubacteriales bacterium]|nr:response regulator transcription factor [Eubacteriales bacterium]
MPGEKVLIVDDEKAINDLIRSYIIKEGFLPFSAYTGKDALAIIEDEQPDLIILDIMLPDIEGTDLSLQIRRKTNVPILFLSCKSEEIDKIIALSAGGDDYMTKPFFPGELIARIKAHLRRQQSSNFLNQTEEDNQNFEFPGLTVNMLTREVFVNEELVNLTAKEFDILKLFIKNPKRIFSADQIYEHVWKMNSLEGDSRTVMVYISTLRKKIEWNASNPKYILSVRGVGYKFNHNLLAENK